MSSDEPSIAPPMAGEGPGPTGLDQGGHLSELTLDRLRSDRPGSHEAFRAAALAHLAACARCQAAEAALARADAEFSLAPPSGRGAAPVVALRPRSTKRWLALAVPLAAAAAVAVAVSSVPSDGEDPARVGGPHGGIVLKGGDLDFEVYVHDGQASRLVTSGAAIRPGDRASFRVFLRQAGYLLVVGADEAGHTYLCWPQDVPPATAAAVAYGPTPAPEVLPAAMRFDDVPGAEHLVGIFCPTPFAYSEVASGGLVMQDAALLEEFRRAHPDCTVRKVVLNKVSGGTP